MVRITKRKSENIRNIDEEVKKEELGIPMPFILDDSEIRLFATKSNFDSGNKLVGEVKHIVFHGGKYLDSIVGDVYIRIEFKLKADCFQVETLLGHRNSRNKSRDGYDYLVKWLGYPMSERTWESGDNISDFVLNMYWDSTTTENSEKIEAKTDKNEMNSCRESTVNIVSCESNDSLETSTDCLMEPILIYTSSLQCYDTVLWCPEMIATLLKVNQDHDFVQTLENPAIVFQEFFFDKNMPENGDWNSIQGGKKDKSVDFQENLKVLEKKLLDPTLLGNRSSIESLQRTIKEYSFCLVKLRERYGDVEHQMYKTLKSLLTILSDDVNLRREFRTVMENFYLYYYTTFRAGKPLTKRYTKQMLEINWLLQVNSLQSMS